MHRWFNTAAVLVILAALLTMFAAMSRAPTVPEVLAPPPHPIPRLIRTSSAEPEIRAEAVLIQRLPSGEVLFERNAEERLPIASLTKLMTALLLVESDHPLGLVTFSTEAKAAGDPDEKRSGVPAGVSLKGEDVILLLLAASDTDAAYAAAEHVASHSRGGESRQFTAHISRFVELMNERAATLGLADTRFANPAGADHPENYSTARDLLRLADAIGREHPELWAASRVRETFIFGLKGERIGVVNTNLLLDEFPAIYGSKTGFDNQAKGALLLIYLMAREEPIAIVILRSPDRTAEGRTAIHWLESSFRLETPVPP